MDHPNPPLTPPPARFVVPDDVLRAITDPGRERGIISDDHQAVLVMALPEICTELLARRAAMRKDGVVA